MAKNNDCIVAECDRCGRFAWYTPSNADALKNDWWDVQSHTSLIGRKTLNNGTGVPMVMPSNGMRYNGIS